MAWGLPCAESIPSRTAFDLRAWQGRPPIITRARHRNGPALSAWVASIITVSSATRPTRAGKMFSACKANIISACGKNVFYRIDRHPPEAAGAARLTACGRGPRARPCGRTARPAGDGNALTGDLTAWRPARPAGETIPLNQEPRTKARGSSRRSNHAPQSSLAAGPAPVKSQSMPLPMSLPWLLPGSCSLLLAPCSLLWSLALALALLCR